MKKPLLSYSLLLIPYFIFSQNIGIGTTAPLAKLHVEGTANNIAIFNGGSQMYLTFAENGVNRGYLGSYSGNAEDVDFGTYAGNTGKLHLVTAGSPRLSVMNNGNIGIGTVTAQQQLSVAAGMNIDQDDTNNGTTTNMLRFGSNSGEGIGSNRSSNIWNLNFFTNSTSRMTISNAGNVGINLNNPGSKLEIRGALGFSSTTKKWEMNYDSTAGYFYIDEFGAGRRFYIKNGGNVGINTNNPQTTLDVNGDINIENKLFLNNSAGSDGQVLVSSGNSAAPTWRSASYGTNDRFMFKTDFWLSTTPANYSHAVEYSNVYSNSGAITYSNGGFTVNKAGFYGIEGMILIAVKVPESDQFSPGVNFFFDRLLPGFYSLRILEGRLDYNTTFNGFKYYDKRVPIEFKIYLPAGALFNFHFSTQGNPPEVLIDDSYPLSIYLISE